MPIKSMQVEDRLKIIMLKLLGRIFPHHVQSFSHKLEGSADLINYMKAFCCILWHSRCLEFLVRTWRLARQDGLLWLLQLFYKGIWNYGTWIPLSTQKRMFLTMLRDFAMGWATISLVVAPYCLSPSFRKKKKRKVVAFLDCHFVNFKGTLAEFCSSFCWSLTTLANVLFFVLVKGSNTNSSGTDVTAAAFLPCPTFSSWEISLIFLFCCSLIPAETSIRVSSTLFSIKRTWFTFKVGNCFTEEQEGPCPLRVHRRTSFQT